MSDDLLPYYEQELVQLRKLSKEFAEKYPKVAGRLQLTGEACEDPHVERMIEASAFLAARIHRKLDDDFPELTSSFLEMLYPHYLRPIPSMSIAKFDADRAAEQLAAVVHVPRDTVLQTRPFQGMPCKFSTCYPVDIAPVRIRVGRLETLVEQNISAVFSEADAVLTLELELASSQAAFSKLRLQKLRVFLNGDPAIAYPLYQLLFRNVQAIVLVEPGKTGELARLAPSQIKPVGFDADEGLLDYDPRSHMGYRLLTEYFAFPDKFLFFDLDLANARLHSLPETVRRIEIRFVLRDFKDGDNNARLLKTVSADTFQLNCVPVVNLFKQAGEPIRVSHTRTEYPIVPDSRRPLVYEVYSIDTVRKVEKSSEGASVSEIYPLHSFNHRRRGRDQSVFWHASRRNSMRIGDNGTEVFMSLVDPDFDPALPKTETISIELSCTNRDLPSQLAFRNPDGDLYMEGGSVALSIGFLKKPTATVRPRLKKGLQWQLISHLALNQSSLVEGGADALAELLSLYDFGGTSFNRGQIEAIRAVTARPAMARMKGNPFPTFVRGMEISLELDEENFAGGASYLFGCVLERFLGLYVTANSFTQLQIVSSQTRKESAKWAPRSGSSVLV
jgi:type VI secretion system protein ImpG